MAENTWVDCNNIADAIRAISDGHTHVSLTTAERFVDQLLPALQGNTTLTALNLRRNPFTPAEVESLIRGLQSASGLNTLYLTSCCVGRGTVEWMRKLTEALKGNTTLANLYLKGNLIRDQGSHLLAGVLEVNPTLKHIHLQGNRIGARGATALGTMLTLNVTLVSLYLPHNEIDCAGVAALADALKVNSTLLELDLENNRVGDNGGVALAEALKVNASLTSIRLSANQMGDLGAFALAEALKVNQTLEQLTLAGTSARDPGVMALARAVATHPSLDLLDLRGLHISEASMQEFAAALQDNEVMTNLMFAAFLRGTDVIRALMERNKPLASRKVLLTVHLEGEQLVFRKMHGEQVAAVDLAEVKDTSINALCKDVAERMKSPVRRLAFVSPSGIRIDAESRSTVEAVLGEWGA